jgi:hypothetical protein
MLTASGVEAGQLEIADKRDGRGYRRFLKKTARALT